MLFCKSVASPDRNENTLRRNCIFYWQNKATSGSSCYGL